jgi:hypothetical protein
MEEKLKLLGQIERQHLPKGLWDKLQANIKSQKPAVVKPWIRYSIAACLALLLATNLLVFVQRNNENPSQKDLAAIALDIESGHGLNNINE